LDPEIAIDNIHAGALGLDCGAIDGIETGPADDECAVEPSAIGFVQHILNGREDWSGAAGRSQTHGREEKTSDH
jgi:hypothetical protein